MVKLTYSPQFLASMRQSFWLSDKPSQPLQERLSEPLQDQLQDQLSERSPIPVDQDLEKLRRQHQLILNSVGEGVYGVDREGKVTFVNPAAAAMIGWEVADLIGKCMHMVLHHSHPNGSPYPVEQCPIYAAFQDGIIHRVTTEVFWRKDGTSFPVEYISTPMRDEQGKLVGAVVVFRDITQRKWAETVLQQANEELELKVQERTAELQQLNEQLKELNDLKSRVVSMVCHEFRNPLNNISLSVSYLARYTEQLSAQQKMQYLEDIQANVERMVHMIDDILVIGKVEAKKIEVQPTPLNLVEFCQSLVAELRLTAPQHSIDVKTPVQSIWAQLDEQLLRSILTNILINSVRYSPPESKVQFEVFTQQNQIVFQVKDQGIGIPLEDIPHLFEPFHRGRNVSNIPGTGLGLSVVKKFVDLLQGRIEVSSQIASGTTFVVRLPFIRARRYS
jgi:PAS domain S-box-containing protein